MEHQTEPTITLDGQEWRVLSRGVTREDGKTFAHLASTTKVVCNAKNGKVPVQICDWVDFEAA